ncbi:MAG: ribosomal protein S18-alanine N-acetyltransferase [Eubacterium sp.]|nr:ribosomal protein S18-alanine N-acetyltransferase [Eubacterium sp.]
MIRTDHNIDNYERFAADIAVVEQQCFHDPWSVQSVLSLYENPDAIVAAEYDDGEICGELMARCAADECELYRIAVLPQHRGKGCAKRLISHLIATCKERGISSIFLEVRQSNAPATALYERSGFEPVSVRKNYYKEPVEDAVIYVLKL